MENRPMSNSEVRALAKKGKKEELEDNFFSHWALLYPDLPEPKRQVQFHQTRKWRWDFSWDFPHIKLAVEIQGGTWMKRGAHNTGVGQTKDYEKWREGVRLGWKILPFNTSDMRDLVAVIELTAEILTAAREVRCENLMPNNVQLKEIAEALQGPGVREFKYSR